VWRLTDEVLSVVVGADARPRVNEDSFTCIPIRDHSLGGAVKLGPRAHRTAIAAGPDIYKARE